jgi:hypothetical protein
MPAKTVWITISAEGRFHSIGHKAEPLLAKTARELLDAGIITPEVFSDLARHAISDFQLTIRPPAMTSSTARGADIATHKPLSVIAFLQTRG